MFILNKGSMRLPIGGHQFPSHGIMFRDDSFEKLVEKLTQFRVTNGFNVGNPEQEILVHYAQNWPYMVKVVPDSKEQEDQDYKMFKDWVREVWNKPPTKILSTKEAFVKADKCRDCKFNVPQPWDQSDESRELAKRAFLLRRGMPVPKDLNYCACFALDLPLAIYLEQPSGDKEGQNHKPSNCWM